MNYSVLVILIESRNPSHLRLLYTGLHGHCLNHPQEPSLSVEEPIMYMHLPILGMRIKIQHKNSSSTLSALVLPSACKLKNLAPASALTKVCHCSSVM